MNEVIRLHNEADQDEVHGGRIARTAQYETKIPVEEHFEDGVNGERAKDKRHEKERNEGTESSPRSAAVAMEYFIFLIK